MRTVFFHEDDYCMVQLLPLEAREYCLAEIGEIEAKSSPQGDKFGFPDLHVRSEPAPTLRSRNISEAALRALLQTRLPPFEEVLTGYSTHREHCPTIRAWGLNDEQALFAQIAQEGFVEEIWFALHGVEPSEVSLWLEVLQSLPGAAELMLVDWYSHMIVPLADGLRLAVYLHGDFPGATLEA